MSNSGTTKKGPTRRDLLKSGAVAAVPLILSLRPDEARAAGSWSSGLQRPYPAGGQVVPPASPGKPRYVVPFSNEWRHQKTKTLEEGRHESRRWGGIGN